MDSDISDKEANVVWQKEIAGHPIRGVIQHYHIDLEGKTPAEVRMDEGGMVMGRFTRNGQDVWLQATAAGVKEGDSTVLKSSSSYDINPENFSFKTGKVMSPEDVSAFTKGDEGYKVVTLIKEGQVTPEGQALREYSAKDGNATIGDREAYDYAYENLSEEGEPAAPPQKSSDISDSEIKEEVITLEGQKPEEVRMSIANGPSEGLLMARYTRNGEDLWVKSNGNGSVDPDDLSFKSGKVMGDDEVKSLMANSSNYITLLENGKVTLEGQALQGLAEAQVKGQNVQQPQEPKQTKPEEPVVAPVAATQPVAPKEETTMPEKEIDIGQIYEKTRQEEIDYVAKTNPQAAKGMQLVHDNTDKTVYLDTRNGMQVTVLDGDKGSIKPFLANQYEQAVKQAGGVDELVKQRTAQMQEAGMPQAVINKEAELMTAAKGNGEEYANLRFENNADFIKMAKEADLPNAEHVNDIFSYTVQKTELVVTSLEDGKPVEEDKPEVKATTETPKIEPFDEKMMVKLSEGGELTRLGKMTMLSEAMMPNRIDFVGGAKEGFKLGVEKYGSVDAFAKHIESGADVPEMGLDSQTDPKYREAFADSVRNSGGDPAVFAASFLNKMNESVEKDAAPATPTASTIQGMQKEVSAKNMSGALFSSMGQISAQQGNMMQAFGPIFNFIKAIMSGKSIELAANELGEQMKGLKKEYADKFGVEDATEDKNVASEQKGQAATVATNEPASKTVIPEPNVNGGKEGVYYGTETADGRPLVTDDDGRRYTFANPDKDGKYDFTPVKPEEMPNYKPEKKAEHVAYKTPEEGTGAGKPVVNTDPEANKYVELKTPDGQTKTMTEAYNTTAQGQGCERVETPISDLAAKQAQEQQQLLAAQEDQQSDLRNTGGMALG